MDLRLREVQKIMRKTNLISTLLITLGGDKLYELYGRIPKKTGFSR